MPLSAFHPESYALLLAEKVARTRVVLQDFDPPEPLVYPSQAEGFRMRAEFRLWHDGDDLNYVMFKHGDAKTPYPIEHFPIACEAIQAIMPTLRLLLRPNPSLRLKLFQVEFLASLSGEMVITLAYHRKLDDEWLFQAQGLRDALQREVNVADSAALDRLSIVGRSRKQKLVVGEDYVDEALEINNRVYRYRQFEQSFTQPNARVNVAMLEWASNQAAQSGGGDLLELYCGNGNFTLPLAQYFDQVVATEVAKSSIKAARHNIRQNNAANIHLIRLSAEEVTQALAGEREFRRLRELPCALSAFNLATLLVDPPRAGLDDHTTRMAGAFNNIIYISCNPQSLATNLASLCQSHRIAHLAMFDQFPYTDHMECGVVLRRRDRRLATNTKS
jgi:tRNA (uracil-5-)-methyltransferase